jgi:hypothetical protein
MMVDDVLLGCRLQAHLEQARQPWPFEDVLLGWLRLHVASCEALENDDIRACSDRRVNHCSRFYEHEEERKLACLKLERN